MKMAHIMHTYSALFQPMIIIYALWPS